MALPTRVLGFIEKLLKNLLLQNHLPQMLEIRYIALPSGPLPILFKSRSEGQTWPYTRSSWVWSVEIHRQYEKNLQFQYHLAKMLEIWYSGLHSWALLSLLKWWPQVPKSSAALGFGLELLNSGERFRAIMTLLYKDLLIRKIFGKNEETVQQPFNMACILSGCPFESGFRSRCWKVKYTDVS